MDVKLQGVRNIRDFTEYGFQGYIRSAHLHDMTESDAEILLKNYKLRMVIDLRTGVKKKEPAGPCHGRGRISAYSVDQ